MIHAPETDRAAFLAPHLEANYPFQLKVDPKRVCAHLIRAAEAGVQPAGRIVDKTERIAALDALLDLIGHLAQPGLFDQPLASYDNT